MPWSVTSSVSEFSHYGVKGMRWGVRNEKETSTKEKRSKAQEKRATVSGDLQRKAVEGHYSNIQRLTPDVKRQTNPDGSFNVTGLKGITNAYFKNEKTYQNWLNGRYNFVTDPNSGSSFDRFYNRVRVFEDRINDDYTITVRSEDPENFNDDDIRLSFDNGDEYLKASANIKSQIGDQKIAKTYETAIQKIGNKKSLSKEVKVLIKKGKAAVEKAVKNATKKASEVMSNASKKIGKFFESMKPKETYKTSSITIDEHVGTRQTGNHNSNKAARDMRRLMNR